MAAANPAGPLPTMATSTCSVMLMATPGGEGLGEAAGAQLGDPRVAVETLAASHAGAGATLQTAEVAGWQRPFQGGEDFPAGDHLAVADDLVVAGTLPVARQVFGEVRYLWPERLANRFVEALALVETIDVACDAQRRGETGGTDAADTDPVASVDLADAVFLLSLAGRNPA